MWKHHARFERHSLWLIIGIIITVSIGGLVEISPLFYLESTIENVKGVRPYTPLEQAGRNIYVREGCYVCHSQMIRPLRDEVERYGHYSLAAESMYDHPFQWGSKRTGPDLARVGGKYSDSWHVDHLTNPRSVVPESNMPPYAFLAKRELDYRAIEKHLASLRGVGVPYTDAQLKNAREDLETQVDAFAGERSGLKTRYGAKVTQRDFDGNPEMLTEMDALVAYLQVLGTMVDFKTYKATDPENLR
ncbi:MAG: cytochrome-c oxidase, cbb3-type subunit II [Phenylobacterium sp.]|uniref:cytochrome-c oxidase, cbb3-type subunit II n=1 Tax=Phenylobacterium sp. TaxID=1871053 RepID=UPI001A5A5D67|nr:cytochrome-c oxidase, cbb3-type subunit II [Phenylobacterium sp.]MBL8770917.1 cytochrome-c oxidase, cbb3-type subunit II [Phenylobacterium sp.]